MSTVVPPKNNKNINNIVRQIMNIQNNTPKTNGTGEKENQKPKTKLLIDVTNKIKKKYPETAFPVMDENAFKTYVEGLKSYQKFMNLNPKIVNSPIFYAKRNQPNSFITEIFVKKGKNPAIKYEIIREDVQQIITEMATKKAEFDDILAKITPNTSVDESVKKYQEAKVLFKKYQSLLAKLEKRIQNINTSKKPTVEAIIKNKKKSLDAKIEGFTTKLESEIDTVITNIATIIYTFHQVIEKNTIITTNRPTSIQSIQDIKDSINSSHTTIYTTLLAVAGSTLGSEFTTFNDLMNYVTGTTIPTNIRDNIANEIVIPTVQLTDDNDIKTAYNNAKTKLNNNIKNLEDYNKAIEGFINTISPPTSINVNLNMTKLNALNDKITKAKQIENVVTEVKKHEINIT
jgi:exonuclease VII small subunit